MKQTHDSVAHLHLSVLPAPVHERNWSCQTYLWYVSRMTRRMSEAVALGQWCHQSLLGRIGSAGPRMLQARHEVAAARRAILNC
jgi:hypothetical protein